MAIIGNYRSHYKSGKKNFFWMGRVFILGSSQVPAMDAIKKKMEKLSAETAAAETRIETFERMKEANEAEAEKYEEQLRLVSNIILSILIKNLYPPNR